MLCDFGTVPSLRCISTIFLSFFLSFFFFLSVIITVLMYYVEMNKDEEDVGYCPLVCYAMRDC